MRRRTMPSPAMVIALIALFVALGGTGYAATSLTANGSATTAAARRHHRSLRGPRGFRGRTGPQGPVGPQGPQGAQGVQGPAGTAKAYAVIDSTGRTVPGHALNITDANISIATRGIYCLNLAGVGITASNAVAIATPDYRDPQTGSGDRLQVNTGSGVTDFNDCPAGQIEVRTYDSTGAFSEEGFDIAFM